MAKKLPPFFTRLRFATSLASTWLLNLGMFGWSAKSLCAPGFNCHGCPWATAACPVGVIAFGSAMHAIPVWAIASVLAVGVALGRLACSFLCPFGLLQDLLFRIPTPKITLPRWCRYGKYVALLLLVLLLPWALGMETGGYLGVDKPQVDKAEGGNLSVKAAVRNLGTEPLHDPELTISYINKQNQTVDYAENRRFAGVTIAPGEKIDLPAFEVPNHLSTADLQLDSPQSRIDQRTKYDLYYCRLCPAGTLTATIPSYFTGASQSFGAWLAARALRLGILLAFLVLMILAARPFCRLFCPLGAMYALTARAAVTRMTLNPDACVSCGLCDKVCPVGLDVRKEVGGSECIACGDCKNICPQSGIKRVVGL